MYVNGPKKVNNYTVLWTVKPIVQSCMMLTSHAPVNHSSRLNNGSQLWLTKCKSSARGEHFTELSPGS